MRKQQWIGSKRWTEQDAVEALQALDASGMTVTAFAEQCRVEPWRFYQWRRRLGDRPSEDAPRFVAVEMSRAPEPASGGRTELEKRPAEVRAGDASDRPAMIEVVLEGGVRIRLRSDFEAEALTRAVQALRSC